MQKPCSSLNVVIFVRSKNDGDVRLDFSREVKKRPPKRSEMSPSTWGSVFRQEENRLWFDTTGFLTAGYIFFLYTSGIRNIDVNDFYSLAFFGMELAHVFMKSMKQNENSKLYSIYIGRWEGKLGCNEFLPFDLKLYYIFSAGWI